MTAHSRSFRGDSSAGIGCLCGSLAETCCRHRSSGAGKVRAYKLTTAAGDIQALRAFQAGAVGYLLKNLLRTELIDTIKMIHAGQRRIPPEIAQQLAEHAAEDELTARELDVLRGIVKGRSNKEIAANLGIVEHTVKNHIKSILAKLDVNDRTGAAIVAVRRGYIDLER